MTTRFIAPKTLSAVAGSRIWAAELLGRLPAIVAVLLGCLAALPAQAAIIWRYQYVGGGDVVSLVNFNNRSDILWSCGQCSATSYYTPLADAAVGNLSRNNPFFPVPDGSGFVRSAFVSFLNSGGQAIGSSQFQSALTGTGGSHPTYWLNGVAFDNSLNTYSALPDPGVVRRDLTSFVAPGTTLLDLVSNPTEMVQQISRGVTGDFLSRYGQGSLSGIMNANNYFVFEAGFNQPMHLLIPIAPPTSSVPEPGALLLVGLGLFAAAVATRRQ